MLDGKYSFFHMLIESQLIYIFISSFHFMVHIFAFAHISFSQLMDFVYVVIRKV